MKRQLWRGWLAAAVLALWVLVPSGPVAEATGYEKLMDGKVAQARVKRVMEEIDWKRDLESALATAKDQNKPLLWLQLVGDLDDGL